MTAQESFDKRIRARMGTIGAQYSAARRALRATPSPTETHSRGWVSQPPHSDQAILTATGRSWDQWVAEIDAGPGRAASHTEIAAWVNANSDIGGWWAQGVTVGYERITGLRLPGQMMDGTFTTARSRTLALSPASLRELLEDDASRAAFLPDVTALRLSKPGVKAPRYALTDRADGDELGILQLSFDTSGTQTRLTVTHAKLPHHYAMNAWQDFWAQWLDIVEEEISAGR